MSFLAWYFIYLCGNGSPSVPTFFVFQRMIEKCFFAIDLVIFSLSLCTEIADNVGEETVCWYQEYDEIVEATMVGDISHVTS